MEQEGVDWLGAFKLCRKNNYVTETLRRIELLYGFGRMTNTERESLRINRFNVMTIGGNAVSNDKLNEFQNLWNKCCVMSPNLGEVSNVIAFIIRPAFPHVLLFSLTHCMLNRYAHNRSMLWLRGDVGSRCLDVRRIKTVMFRSHSCFVISCARFP